jgi:MFS family permease
MNLGIGAGGVISGSFVDLAHPGTFQTIYVFDGLSYVIPLVVLLSLPQVGRRLVQVTDTTGKERGGYAIILRDKPFLRFVLFGLLLTTFGYAQIEVGLTAYSVHVAGVAPHVLGWAFAGNTLLIVVAQLFVSQWLEGRSRTRALATAAAIFAVSWVVLAIAGVAGGNRVAAVAVVAVIASAVIFAMGETLMSPTMPAITNALATDEVRGRYNAVGSMIWGVSGVIGPVVAGPLIAHGLGPLWITLVILGCVGAAAMGLRFVPDAEATVRLAAVTDEALSLAGPRHWPTGAPDAVHFRVRAIEARRNVIPDHDALVARCAAALARATDATPVRLRLAGLTLTPSGVMACAYPADDAADRFAARLGRELGDDGWFEAAFHRDVWYATVVHFTGDLADPAGLVRWVAERRQLDLGPATAGNAELIAFRYTGRHMTRVALTQNAPATSSL